VAKQRAPSRSGETHDELDRLRDRLAETGAELERARSDLAEVRRAHDAQARHLVIERLVMAESTAAFMEEVEELKADVEWRKGVMRTYEEQLETLHSSRTFRYTASLRRLAGALRSRRS
jgi:chromosome segregation ATPase